MRLFGLILFAVFAALFVGALWVFQCVAPVDSDGNVWVGLYFAQARVPMFTGFLTLGSFLLTLQTAIIQRLKDAYDTDSYKERYLILKERDRNVRYYGSLERMSVALSTNVILALCTAASQLTVGFLRTEWSTAFCIAIAITSLSLVVYLTIELLLAHKEWFEKIENERQKQLQHSLISVSVLWPGEVLLGDSALVGYRATLSRGGSLPPVDIIRLEDGRLVVRDGNTRVRAFIEHYAAQNRTLPDIDYRMTVASAPGPTALAGLSKVSRHYGEGVAGFLKIPVVSDADYEREQGRLGRAILG